MQIQKISLRTRIFLSMTFLVVVASIMIAAVSVYQYREQDSDYHEKRLERKEAAIKLALEYQIKESTPLNQPIKIDSVLKSCIDELADIHDSEILFYNLEGNLIVASKKDSHLIHHQNLTKPLLQHLALNPNHRIINKFNKEGVGVQALYFYIYDTAHQPLAIFHLPYFNNNADSDYELEEFLKRLAGVYLFMFFISIVVAYIISSYITKSLKTVSDKIHKTGINKHNEKIKLKNASTEIFNLVNAYNGMIDELEESAKKLAQSEREAAWREMAKQVAHEIKNPLTPMRLTIQSFQQRFDATAPDYKHKLNEFCAILIEQIDTMSAVASAFSSFAAMPIGNSEPINVVLVVKNTLDIFTEESIEFSTTSNDITIHFDKPQMIRVITNLVKNAIQASQLVAKPKIELSLSQTQNEVFIKVKDNGEGIAPENAQKVFEPKFTTKNSGMGLGLAIVKKIIETYKGSINFTSELGKGTEFTIRLPKE